MSVMLCVLSLARSLDMNRLRISCLPSLGHVTTSTNTSMGETKSLSRLAMGHWHLCSNKAIHKSPERLQRMRLALQKDNLEVQ